MDTELTPPVPRLSAPLPPEDARRLRRLADRADAVKAELDQAIYDAYLTGASLRALAEATGMSHAGIRKLVLRLGADATEVDT